MMPEIINNPPEIETSNVVNPKGVNKTQKIVEKQLRFADRPENDKISK